VDRLSVLVRQLQGMLGGKAIRGGTGEVTFTASNGSATTTIAHGLGGVPASVQITATEGVGINYQATKDATNIYVIGDYPFGVLTDTLSFDWLAIG
jgi:hypothetical protein